MISRKLLCAATLLCLAPLAASAAEAHLTPKSNGDSGAMPSGYSKLFFEISDSDFAAELKLPANPRDGDQVALTSMAGRRVAMLDAAGTSAADLVYIPVQRLSNLVLAKSDSLGRWYVGRGLDDDRIVLRDGPHAQAPATEKTFIDLHVTRTVSSVSLPPQAPARAVLGLVNYTQNDVTIQGPEVAGGVQTCGVAQSCGFVFDGADGQWHARRGRAHFQPTTAQLPKMQQRWTDIVLSGPAEDVTTPRNMTLPVEAVDGDIIQITDLSNSRYYSVNGHPINKATYRYNASEGRWGYSVY
ncbi:MULTISPECIES: hypothetical protein [Stenotrophomonas]|uniref:hypothetical protein n=1 Tax=Stenotrophomonas TaxID=40323 RepID=UPI0007F8DADD|nr:MULTISPECIES: hypothetical protein [Stenotrophomonas]AYA90894.1 hypothetical protein PEM_09095 [Stenotrophomonas sp. Pemsol]MCU1006423.1 hypothetical protein [Stenotrophomonas maltophilia]OBU67670.1 hypothetical protein A9J40_07125 [Stenotrophomonas maltophilia]PSD24841.1 hypothetical protein C7E13_02805 [Stenotrophomonas maltophilia]PZS97151.1 hypothetical protein A7X90_06250 [Stenotrophomonas maltophilia]